MNKSDDNLQKLTPIHPAICKLTNTPAGQIALHAISGAEPPWIGSEGVENTFKWLHMSLSFGVAIRLEAATRDLDANSKIAFLQEFVAVLNTLWLWNMGEQKFEAWRKHDNEVLKLHERIPGMRSTPYKPRLKNGRLLGSTNKPKPT